MNSQYIAYVYIVSYLHCETVCCAREVDVWISPDAVTYEARRRVVVFTVRGNIGKQELAII